MILIFLMEETAGQTSFHLESDDVGKDNSFLRFHFDFTFINIMSLSLLVFVYKITIFCVSVNAVEMYVWYPFLAWRFFAKCITLYAHMEINR